MNSSNFLHALLAAIIQIVLGLVTQDWFLASAVPVALFIGREEHTYEVDSGLGRSLKGFAFWKWSTDSQLDVLFPIAAVVIIYTVLHLFGFA